MNILFQLRNDQVLLRSDALNYELCKCRKRNNDDGTTTDEWTPIKFFASLSHALNTLIDMKVRASDATSLKQLAADIKTAQAEVMQEWKTTA